ncbi:MAG TPA: PfkB family carbohydrate kinase [Microthrixaceae bacterium]|nr:hypothetical protein [Microthrixaceae bacterium]HNI33919.1 PfkB family carbohydrate kinase [Microthrixaceae bacterium]
MRYVAVGHVCVDELFEQPERLGGTVFFSAAQAAAMGCEVTVATSCTSEVAARARRLLPDGTDLQVTPTNLDTRFEFAERAELGPQRLLSIASTVNGFASERMPDVLHLAPIFNEIDGDLLRTARDRAHFVGATPQGLLRGTNADGALRFVADHWPDVDDFADAIVLNDEEYLHLAGIGLLDRFSGWVFRTLGAEGAALLRRGVEVGRRPLGPWNVEVPPPRTIGAGDVFAAAAFVSLARGDDPTAALGVAVRSSAAYVRRTSDRPVFTDGTPG